MSTSEAKPAAPANPFQPVARKAQLAKVLFFGPSKSGKTLSALLVARGLVGTEGRIAVLDTEGGRSALEAGRPELVTDAQPSGFDMVPLLKPYSPAVLQSVVDLAKDHAYACLIIDGISPFWEGPGGVQEIADQNTKGANKFSGWAVATPEHQKLLGAIMHAPLHVICTCRSKQEYLITEDGNGKKAITKVGLKPVQRDGIEYEFDIAGLLMADHSTVLEARGPFEGMRVDHPGIGFGQQLAGWLSSGLVTPPGSEAASEPAPAPEGSTPTPAAASPQNGAEGGSDPFTAGPVPAGGSTLTDAGVLAGMIDRLSGLAGQLAELDPEQGTQTDRVNSINAYAERQYGHPVVLCSVDEVNELIEIAETHLLRLQEAAKS